MRVLRMLVVIGAVTGGCLALTGAGASAMPSQAASLAATAVSGPAETICIPAGIGRVITPIAACIVPVGSITARAIIPRATTARGSCAVCATRPGDRVAFATAARSRMPERACPRT